MPVAFCLNFYVLPVFFLGSLVGIFETDWSGLGIISPFLTLILIKLLSYVKTIQKHFLIRSLVELLLEWIGVEL